MRPTPRLRIVSSFLLVLSFTCLTQAGCASLQGASYGFNDPIWTPPLTSDPPPESTPLTLQNLVIPAEHGTIKETWDSGKQGPIVLHMQDAFANYAAQKHNAAILDHLIRQHGLSLVLVEGGSRDDSLSHMRSYAPLKKRLRTAEEFLRSGKISGENYLDLATDHNFLIYGVEKPELYDAQMQAQKELLKIQPRVKEALKYYFATIGRYILLHYFPKRLEALIYRESDMNEGRLPLLTHCRMLLEECKAAGVDVDLTQYPMLDRFLKEGSLEDPARRADYDALMNNVDALTYRLKDAYAETSDDREVLQLAKDINYFSDMVELKLIPRQYAYCIARKGQFQPEVWAERLRVLNDSRGLDAGFMFFQKLQFDPVPLREALDPAFRFYEVTVQRDAAMVDNALKWIGEFNVPFAAMIAGGFHTPEIIRLLKGRQVSYAIIAPKVERVTAADDRRYLKVVAETYQPMSKEYRMRAKESAQAGPDR